MPGKEITLRCGDEGTASSSALAVVTPYPMTLFELELQPEGCGSRDGGPFSGSCLTTIATKISPRQCDLNTAVTAR